VTNDGDAPGPTTRSERNTVKPEASVAKAPPTAPEQKERAPFAGPDTHGLSPDEPPPDSSGRLFSGPLPDDLRPGQRPALDTDEGGLWMIADRIEDRLQDSGNRIHDEQLNRYVNEIACKVAHEFCDDIRVYVLRHPGFNASMTPNGTMVVWSGLLLRARNEAQLATVLGHEIGHFMRRHSVQRMRDARNRLGFLAVFSMAMGVTGIPVASEAAQIAVIGGMFGFSRDNEREADSIGIQLLANAGYDPREAPKVWANLIAEMKSDEDYEDRSVFFATHPQSDERMGTLDDIARELVKSKSDPIVNETEYQSIVAPHRAMFLSDELDLRRHEPIATLIQSLILEGNNVAELYYFLGESYRLRNQEDDDRNALEAYPQALSAAGTVPPEIHRSMGLIYRKQGATGDADASFRRYLEAAPDAEDRAIIEMILKRMS
jgi:predicted Zn-dependent protease